MTFTRLRSLPDPDHLPALDAAYLSADPARGLGPTEPAPRILLLYGSLRERSYSRFCVEEAARLLQRMGCETRIFDPSDLPLPGAPGGVVWCDGRRPFDIAPGMEVEARLGAHQLLLARTSEQPFVDRLVRKFELPVDGWRAAAGRARRDAH